jgi:hypothetical protein
MKITLTLLLTTAVIFLVVSPVRAFSISPVKILLTADPDVNQTTILKINNSEKTDQIFKLDVLGTTQDETGLPVFGRGTEVAESWVYPENNTVKVKAGETKSVSFIVNIPSDAAAGSHYFGLAVEPVVEDSKNNLNSRLVSLLFLQVKGLVREELLVEKWEPRANISNNKNLTFSLKLKNSGVVEVPLRGTVAVRNWHGDEIFSEPIVLGNKLLADSYRVLSPKIILRDNISLPGLYQFQLKVNYGLTNQMSSAIAYVWYFPSWSRWVVVFFGLLIILAVIFLIKRKK